jgi:hypothetical protein
MHHHHTEPNTDETCADCYGALDEKSVGINGGTLCGRCYDQRLIDAELWDSQPVPSR